jgi:hypothetical protein
MPLVGTQPLTLIGGSRGQARRWPPRRPVGTPAGGRRASVRQVPAPPAGSPHARRGRPPRSSVTELSDGRDRWPRDRMLRRTCSMALLSLRCPIIYVRESVVGMGAPQRLGHVGAAGGGLHRARPSALPHGGPHRSRPPDSTITRYLPTAMEPTALAAGAPTWFDNSSTLVCLDGRSISQVLDRSPAAPIVVALRRPASSSGSVGVSD